MNETTTTARHEGDGTNEAFSCPDEPAGREEREAGEPEYLTAGQVARKLSVSLGAVQKWTMQRRIPATKCGYHWRYPSLEINKRLLSGQLLSPMAKR
jgi:excisionase family DNA binding protein